MHLLHLFVYRPNNISSPDGRPFYAYHISEATLQRIEEALAHVWCTDVARVQLLAFVASERFRRTYREGPWSWDDCGETVAMLRDTRGHSAFNTLIGDGLKYWKLPLLPIHPKYLGQIVAYGGFPAAFLRGQSPLRAILRQLLRKRIAQGSGELRSNAAFQIAASNLPAAFKSSPFFTDLCIDLIDTVADLSTLTGGSAVQLETLDESHPGWQRKLALSYDGEDAKHLVSELLNLASEAKANKSVLLGFRRFLVQAANQWKLSASIEDVPSRLALPDGCAAGMYRLQLLADGESVRELTRLAKQSNSQYAPYPRLRASDLALEAPFDHSSISLGMQIESPEGSVELPTEGGEPLDAELPWVFTPSDVGARSATDITHYEFVGSGSLRVRSSSAVLAVPASWTVTADVQIDVGDLRGSADEFARKLIKIEGAAAVDGGEAGEFSIRCNSIDNGARLKLSGRNAGAHSPTARHVFRGSPIARVVPPIDGAVIEWRSVGGGHQEMWSRDLGAATGAVRYRVSDAQGPLAETRAVVLPSTFTIHSTPDALKLVLGAGWKIVAPNGSSASEGAWHVPMPLGYELPTFDILVSTPFSTRPLPLRVPVFSKGCGLRRLLDGTSAPQTLSASQLSEFVAYANTRTAFLRLYLEGNAGFPYRLRSDGVSGSRLPLAFIADDLQDLRYSSVEIDVPMSLEFLGQRPIRVSLPRLLRTDDAVVLQKENAYRGEIRLRHLSSEVECVLESSGEGTQEWRLPAEFPFGWSIVTSDQRSVRPLAVRLGDQEKSHEGEASTFAALIQEEGSTGERIARFRAHLGTVLDHAIDDAAGEELAYLRQWLLRFDDIPSEYLDLPKAIAKAPADAVRLLAYCHGSPAFESLRATLTKVPLYWHLCPTDAWASFLPWWSALLGADSSDLTDNVSLALAEVHLEGMALDSDTSEIYRAFLRQRISNCVTKSNQYRSLAEGLVIRSKQQWRVQVAALVEDFHGAIFPELGSVELVVNQLATQSALDIDFTGAPGWTVAVLRAPMVAAWIACHGGEISDDLRRQLAYSRHLGRSDFDRLYANTSMLLEQMP